MFFKNSVKKIRKGYLAYPILPKAKEVTFIHLITFLHERCNLENNACGFCEKDIETVEHMFFQCELVPSFWLHSKHI